MSTIADNLTSLVESIISGFTNVFEDLIRLVFSSK